MAVIPGLDRFAEWFAPHRDKYVLIGGCAASTVMEEAGLAFRATKDLDIVLIVEAIDAEFVHEFWRFVEAGGYAVRHQGDGKRCFYRFGKPTQEGFPKLLELFARQPDLFHPLREANGLTPIPIEDEVESLSAILLDDDAYHFLLEGRTEIGGVPLIDQDRLIPLKAQAWMELSDRRDAGEQIDSINIRKHLKDVVRLSELLTPDRAVSLPPGMAASMRRFLERTAALSDADMTAFESRARFDQAIGRVASTFGPQ